MAVGSILIPAMVKAGYPVRSGAGVVAAAGGLGILLALGRRWVARGQKKLAAAPAALVEDETYADRLDDELRETD